MNTRDTHGPADANRAREFLAIKAVDVKSGAIRKRAVEARTDSKRVQKHTQKRTSGKLPPTQSIVTRSSAYVEPQEREAMIGEAAYFRSAHRGFEPGHEVDDWLAAEAEIDAALARGDLPRFGI
jgi:hypothetical protein